MGCHREGASVVPPEDGSRRLNGAHAHPADSQQTQLFDDLADKLQVVEVAHPGELKAEEELRSPDRAFLAFTTCEPRCAIFFKEDGQGQWWELQIPSFSPTRPFSDLAWEAQTILVFDQWSQPHYGVHYAVDVAKRKLLQASPFQARAETAPAAGER